MSFPVLAKTWQFDVNQMILASDTGADQTRAAMFALKQSLKGFALFGWTVWGSCDGAGGFGNGDAVDRWAAAANCIWATAGSNHSWIVLQQAGLSAKFAICIDLNFSAGTSGSATVMMSPSAGFGAANGGADGTATARPTATDEVQLVSGAWGCSNSALRQHRLHVMQSTDGKCTRIFICYANIITGFWMFDVAASPIAAWSPAIVGAALGGTTSRTSYSVLAVTATPPLRGRIAITVNLLMTGESYSTAFMPNTHISADDSTELWPLFGIGLFTPTAAHRGVKGQLTDMWWAASPQVSGDHMPGDASRTIAQFGNILVPWDGTEPLTS